MLRFIYHVQEGILKRICIVTSNPAASLVCLSENASIKGVSSGRQGLLCCISNILTSTLQNPFLDVIKRPQHSPIASMGRPRNTPKLFFLGNLRVKAKAGSVHSRTKKA